MGLVLRLELQQCSRCPQPPTHPPTHSPTHLCASGRAMATSFWYSCLLMGQPSACARAGEHGGDTGGNGRACQLLQPITKPMYLPRTHTPQAKHRPPSRPPAPPTHPLFALLQLPLLPQVRLPGVGPRQPRRLRRQLRVHVQPAAKGQAAGMDGWVAQQVKQAGSKACSLLPTRLSTFHSCTPSHNLGKTAAPMCLPLDVVQHLVASPPGGDVLILQAGAGRGESSSKWRANGQAQDAMQLGGGDG